MIKFLEHKVIDKVKWDRCIKKADQQLPYGFSWFLDIAANNKWNALVLNDYEGVMPLPYKKKIGFHFIYQPFFTQQLGLFGKGNPLEFIESIPASYRHIHTHLNWKNEIAEDAKFKTQVNLVLDLDKSFEELSQNFSENCRRNIKKTGRNALSVKKCRAEDLVTIFRQTRGKEISHLKKENYQTLLRLIHEFESRKMGHTTGIYSPDKELLGGAVIVKFGGRNIFFFSSLSEKGKKLGGIFFLMLNLIKDLSSHVGLLDFEGSNNAALARFYRGFGATEQNYVSYINNRLPSLIKRWKK